MKPTHILTAALILLLAFAAAAELLVPDTILPAGGGYAGSKAKSMHGIEQETTRICIVSQTC